MTILIDDRAGSAELAPLFSSKTEIVRLDSADFAFEGNGPRGKVNIGIERKTLPDLLSSIESCRLFDQIRRMADEYDRSWLIVEGRTTDKLGELVIYSKGLRQRTMQYKPEAVDGILRSLTCAYGIDVTNTRSKGKTVDEIELLYNWWQKPWDEHTVNCTWNPKSMWIGLFREPSFRAKFISLVPGVGVKKAIAIAKVMPTARAMMDATIKDWMKVDGIGKGLAKRIIKELDK